MPLAAVLLGAGFYIYNRSPERRWGCLRNEVAHCPNCSSFLRNAMEFYAEDHEGWFPKGGPTPLDSLLPLIEEYDLRIGNMTSHAFAGELYRYFTQHHAIAPDYCCYRYNEGLRQEDPDDLIVLYYFRPTRWTSHSSKGNTVGRQVLNASGWGWDFVPESEFQQKQAETLRYLADRRARESELERVQALIRLQLHAAKSVQGAYRITASIRNMGEDDADVRFLQDGAMVEGHFRSRSGHFLVKKGTSMILMPGESKVLPGWLELSVLDVETNARVTQRFLLMKSEGSESSGTGGGQGELDRKTFDSNYFIQGTVRLNVSMGSITNLDCVIKSERWKYLLEDA